MTPAHWIRVEIAPGREASLRLASFTADKVTFTLEIGAQHVNESEGTMRVHLLEERWRNVLVRLLGQMERVEGDWQPTRGPQDVWLRRDRLLRVAVESDGNR